MTRSVELPPAYKLDGTTLRATGTGFGPRPGETLLAEGVTGGVGGDAWEAASRIVGIRKGTLRARQEVFGKLLTASLVRADWGYSGLGPVYFLRPGVTLAHVKVVVRALLLELATT